MKEENAIVEFLRQSNYIEDERSERALDDAIEAWEYASKIDVMTSKDVLEIHRILMHRIKPSIAGKIRTVNVYVGGVFKIMRPVDEIEHDLNNILAEMVLSIDLAKVSNETQKRLSDRAKRCHVAFEDLHPFEDGNGRVGRILWQWHRRRLNLPVKIIHEGIEQMDYYKWFKK